MTAADHQRLERMENFRTIPALAALAGNFLKHNLVDGFHKPFLPRAMCIYVTYRCNMRCRMCGIWKQDARKESELSLAEWNSVLSDPLFSRLELININGGEPNLRDDLPDLTRLFIGKFPHLRAVSLNSNGLPAGRIVETAKVISAMCREKSIRFSISISLHKIGPGYDEIAGIKGAFKKVSETLKILKKIQDDNNFYLGINCVITSLNVPGIEEVGKWGEGEGIPVNFTLGEVRERFINSEAREVIEVKGGEKEAVIEFFRALSRKRSLYNHHALRYRELAEMLERGKKRRLACHYAMGGVIVGWEGSLFYCKDSKAIGNCRSNSAFSIYYNRQNLEYREKELLQDKCRHCPPNTFNRLELEKDIARYLWFVIKP